MKTLNIFLLALTLVLVIQSDSQSQWTGDPNNPMVVCNDPLIKKNL
ncbi:MAG: hypothetical protein IPL53_02725 [Ignavibacteria bacterium]|nr:hypothetical protein [Ignavibacteria bacterium]